MTAGEAAWYTARAMSWKYLHGQIHTTDTVHPPLRALVRERWLLVAQIGWLIGAAVVIGIYAVAVPEEWHHIQLPCVEGDVCHWSRLLPHHVRMLASYDIPYQAYVTTLFTLKLLTALLYLLIAAMIYWRKRHDGMALFGATMLLAQGLTTTGFFARGGLHGHAWALMVLVMGFVSETILTFFFAMFPTKSFVPRFAPFLVTLNLGLYLIQPALPDAMRGLGIRILNAAWLGTLVGVQLYRYRRVSNAGQRQQSKWVVIGAVLGLGLNAVLMIVIPVVRLLQVDPTEVVILTMRLVYYALGLFVPLAFGIAILRDGLYNLDIWMRRTVVYGLLTGCVVALYVLLVGATSAVFRTSGNLLVSLLATGTIALVFQPLRQQLQRGVNRMLYGERDEPYAVLARLGQRLGATVAPDAVLPTVVVTIHDALKLPYVAITAQEEGELVPVAEIGTPVKEPLHVPLIYQHTPIGELILGPRSDDPFGPADRRLFADLAQQISIAVHATRLTRDLQASRERLVTAREEERLRLRRDLHDGLGPSLASLSMQLDTARAVLPGNPEAGMELLAATQGEIKEAIHNVRRLVYALRPPALDQFGLVAALREHAVREGHRHSLGIALDAPEALPPLPAAVEVAAYYIALEAITNVVRHAHARRCTVRLWIDTALHLVVADDGVGVPGAYQAGIGLHSMQERAAELGGTCTIMRGDDGGTVVRATLPLRR